MFLALNRSQPVWKVGKLLQTSCDGNVLLLYVDGKLTRETKYGKKPAANPFPLSIGDGFVGKIARVTLFDRALDPSEISILADRRDEASCRPAPR